MEAILVMEGFDDSLTETMSMAVSEETDEVHESLDTEVMASKYFAKLYFTIPTVLGSDKKVKVSDSLR